jgi:PAS domain S-box-containing protein
MAPSADMKLGDPVFADAGWLVEAAPCALLAIDEQQIICFANPATEQLFGYENGELLGKPLSQVVVWAVRASQPPASAAENYRTQLELHGPGNGRDVSGIRKNGAVLQLEVTLSQPANAAFAIAAISDVTERKRREEALTRSNHDLEQFAYIASHDLREPLRMVSSFLGLLVQRYKAQLDADAQRYIHFAVDGATRMQRLLDGLLLYSRVGSQKTSFGAVDVAQTLRAAWLNLAQPVKDSAAQLEVEALPVVHADGKLLLQLFQAILDNALKFRNAAPPLVKLSARSDEQAGTATISFQDNGIGFDMKHRDKVFEVFKRLHEIGKYEGAGIGLAIAKRIVEQHHGTIDISAAPDAGCTVHVTLPLQRQ